MQNREAEFLALPRRDDGNTLIHKNAPSFTSSLFSTIELYATRLFLFFLFLKVWGGSKEEGISDYFFLGISLG